MSSLTEDQKAQEQQKAIQRCLREGSVWLNPVFRFQDRPIRILRRRFTGLEIFWALLSAVVVALVLIGMSMIFGSGGPFFFLFSPMAIIVWSLVAMVLGRRIAFISPLRRQTGEGTGTWINMMIKRIITRMSFAFSRPVMYNHCTSRAGDPHMEEQRVECIEWLGTAHSPRAPYSNPEGSNTYNEVELFPRGRAIRNHKMNGSGW